MARPRVFVSSTFYDLKHIRASLDIFIESLGYDSILSEKGDIAYSHDAPLDESCYREVGTADVFVLIISGRYGSAASSQEKVEDKVFERYQSITKLEHEEALKRDIPIYILIEAPVYAEYHTYLRNRESKSINYFYVDSVNVFRMIEEILSRRRNNPVHTFERFSDIESWLREQWAGLFRDLLFRKSGDVKLKALSDQVNDLREVTKTLKRYLEEVVKKVSPATSETLIESEKQRLDEAKMTQLMHNQWVIHVERQAPMDIAEIFAIIRDCKSLEDFCERVEKQSKIESVGSSLLETLRKYQDAVDELNRARLAIGLEQLRFESNDAESRADAEKPGSAPTSRRRTRDKK